MWQRGRRLAFGRDMGLNDWCARDKPLLAVCMANAFPGMHLLARLPRLYAFTDKLVHSAQLWVPSGCQSV